MICKSESVVTVVLLRSAVGYVSRSRLWASPSLGVRLVNRPLSVGIDVCPLAVALDRRGGFQRIFQGSNSIARAGLGGFEEGDARPALTNWMTSRMTMSVLDWSNFEREQAGLEENDCDDSYNFSVPTGLFGNVFGSLLNGLTHRLGPQNILCSSEQRQRRSHLRDYLLTLAEIHGLVTVFVSSHGPYREFCYDCNTLFFQPWPPPPTERYSARLCPMTSASAYRHPRPSTKGLPSDDLFLNDAGTCSIKSLSVRPKRPKSSRDCSK